MSRKYLILSVLLALLMGTLFVTALVTPELVLAAATDDSSAKPGDTTVKPGDETTKPPSVYLSNLYIWFLGFVGIAALFAIVWGGIQYMFSGANLTKAEAGRTWITNAIWGIVLAAAAYLILFTINPDLVTHGFNINVVIDNALKTK